MAMLDWMSTESGLRLDGGIVGLRPPRMSDHAEWSQLRHESRAFLQPWEPTWAEDDLTRPAYRRRLDAWRRDMDLGLAYPFFVFNREDDALVGGVTLSNVRRGVAQTGTLGYWAGQKFARRGYILAGVKAVSRFSFGALALSRLEAACLKANEPSANLLLKAGFTEEGFAKAYLKINGVWRDHRLFGLISRDRARDSAE
ncbi:GNAT family N-acetyltransferase [Caulobacter ginsengisoli]|nr:GNAT family protein [Caulobacter ginsengisoli]